MADGRDVVRSSNGLGPVNRVFVKLVETNNVFILEANTHSTGDDSFLSSIH